MSTEHDEATAWLETTLRRLLDGELVPKVFRRLGSDAATIALEAPGEHIVIQVYRERPKR